MTSPLSQLLARGYFPKELPPPFNTKSFGTFAETAPAVFHLDTTKKGIKNNLTTRSAVHNLARTGTLRRKLTIPNPVSQYQIARAVAEGWVELKSACVKSPSYLSESWNNPQFLPFRSMIGAAIQPRIGGCSASSVPKFIHAGCASSSVWVIRSGWLYCRNQA